LDSWSKLYENSGVYSAIFSELVCIVSKYPKKIHRDINNDLHNLNGVAVEWNYSTDLSIFDCYYVRGTNIKANIFNKIKNKTYTVEEFFQETNEEVKSSAILMMQELYGDTFLVDFLREHLREIDTYIDKKTDDKLVGTTNSMNIGVYTLFKGNILNTDVAYVRCYCPSTDRMFFLGVESKYDNAKDAIASLYRVPKKLKEHIMYIQRQGERFSTVFDEYGTSLLKNNELSKEDIQNVVSISGNDYFSKMKYEF
jgi:hypothetical protein